MRMIDADALTNTIEDTPWYSLYNGCMINGAKDEVGAWYKAVDILAAVENAPTIDAVPVKHGRWLVTKASIHPYGNDVKCSSYGHRQGSTFGYKYCPNCGAKMDEENEA